MTPIRPCFYKKRVVDLTLWARRIRPAPACREVPGGPSARPPQRRRPISKSGEWKRTSSFPAILPGTGPIPDTIWNAPSRIRVDSHATANPRFVSPRKAHVQRRASPKNRPGTLPQAATGASHRSYSLKKAAPSPSSPATARKPPARSMKSPYPPPSAIASVTTARTGEDAREAIPRLAGRTTNSSTAALKTSIDAAVYPRCARRPLRPLPPPRNAPAPWPPAKLVHLARRALITRHRHQSRSRSQRLR